MMLLGSAVVFLICYGVVFAMGERRRRRDRVERAARRAERRMIVTAGSALLRNREEAAFGRFLLGVDSDPGAALTEFESEVGRIDEDRRILYGAPPTSPAAPSAPSAPRRR